MLSLLNFTSFTVLNKTRYRTLRQILCGVEGHHGAEGQLIIFSAVCMFTCDGKMARIS